MKSKAKDRILAELKANKPLYEIKGLSRYIDELEEYKYVECTRNVKRDIIAIRITDKGNRFLFNGGYEKQRRTKIMATVRKAAKWFLVTLAGAALIELATQAVRHWLSQ